MVKIMLSSGSRQQEAVWDGNYETEQYGGCGMGEGFGHTHRGGGLRMDPSTCVFWSAVALGALVKGSPIESVSR